MYHLYLLLQDSQVIVKEIAGEKNSNLLDKQQYANNHK